MIPPENRLEMFFPEGQELLKGYIEKQVIDCGGRVAYHALTPEGWRLIGWAPAPLVDRLRELGPELGFKVSSLEEVGVS